MSAVVGLTVGTGLEYSNEKEEGFVGVGEGSGLFDISKENDGPVDGPENVGVSEGSGFDSACAEYSNDNDCSRDI